MPGRTIRLYLVDGTPTGTLTAEIINWTGHVLVSARSKLADISKRDELKRTGLYCLVGKDPEHPLQEMVYIGEGDSVLSRLAYHERDESKDFWTRTIIVTSKELYADIVADCLTIPSCPNRTDAYSLLEAIRMGATHVLDMHLEDLQILVIGHVDRDEVDGMLWDPMPGGSGLLDQIRDRFGEVIAAALGITSECPSLCEHSCIDCLQTFRNGYYHKHLDRHVASTVLHDLGGRLDISHELPPRQPSTHSRALDTQPVNDGETKLKHLLQAAGFCSGEFQQQIRFAEPIVLDHQIGSTTPDVFFVGNADDPDDKGICIYLDGMSSSLHGDPTTATRDREIRSWLRNHGYQVIEITYVELDDREAMIRHFRKLARYLSGRELADELSQNTAWLDASIRQDHLHTQTESDDAN